MNYSFMDNFSNMDPTIFSCLLGMVVGMLLEVAAVFMTVYIVKRAGQPKQSVISETKTVAAPVVKTPRPTMVEQPRTSVHVPITFRRETSIRRTPPTPAPAPAPAPAPSPIPATEYEEEEYTEPEEQQEVSVPRSPGRFSTGRYLYYVTGIDEPFRTLKEAVYAFPDEVGKYDVRGPQWAAVAQYVRDNIRREEIK